MNTAKNVKESYEKWKKIHTGLGKSYYSKNKCNYGPNPHLLSFSLNQFILESYIAARKCLDGCNVDETNVDETINDYSFISPLKTDSKESLDFLLDPAVFSGVFYSVMISLSEQEELELNLPKTISHLNFLGCFNGGKEITISGVVGDMAGFFMGSGKIILGESENHVPTGDYCGYGQDGGEIEVNRVAGKKIAQHQMGGVIKVNKWEQGVSSIGNTYGGLVQIAQNTEGILPIDVYLYEDAKGTVMYGDIPIVKEGELKCSKHPHLDINVKHYKGAYKNEIFGERSK